VQITIDDYLERKNHLLQRLELLELDDFKTKSQFVKELIEITVPVLASGMVDGFTRDKSAIYLWEELEKHNVSYSYGHFIELFPEDLKRKYQKSTESVHLAHDFIKMSVLSDGTIVKKCVCGQFEINGMQAQLVEKASPIEAKPKSKKDSAKEEPKSIILLANKTTLEFLEIFTEFVEEFDSKCKNPAILKDLENSMEYKDLAKMCMSLQSLYSPPMDVLFHEGAPASIMNQMLDETNFRAPATMLQKGLCKLLQSLTTYRQWAHKLSISPRQHQRVRERLNEWPDKKAEKLVDNVLGSHVCPSCEFNLVSLKGNPSVKVIKSPGKNKEKIPKILYGEKWYEVPEKYREKGMNPIEVAYEVFAGKISLKN